MPDVVIAYRTIQLGLQVVLRFILQLVRRCDVDRLTAVIVRQKTAMAFKLSPQGYRSGIVSRPPRSSCIHGKVKPCIRRSTF